MIRPELSTSAFEKVQTHMPSFVVSGPKFTGLTITSTADELSSGTESVPESVEIAVDQMFFFQSSGKV